MDRKYIFQRTKRVSIFLLVIIMSFPVFPVAIFADPGIASESIQGFDPSDGVQELDSNISQSIDSNNDRVSDLIDGQDRDLQNEEGANNEDAYVTDSMDGDEDLKTSEPENKDEGEYSQVAEPENGDEDIDKDSQTTEPENGNKSSGLQVTEPGDGDESDGSQVTKSEDKEDSAKETMPALSDDPALSEDSYEDEDENDEGDEVVESLFNIVTFELVFDNAPLVLKSSDDMNPNRQCGFGLLFTDMESGMEYSFILNSENNDIKIPSGTYSVAAGGIAPLGYQITDIPFELVIDNDQEENLTIPVTCGLSEKKGIYVTAICELVLIGNEDAQSLVAAIEFDGIVESDMTTEGEDYLFEQELSEEYDPESLNEVENESDLISSQSEDETALEDLIFEGASDPEERLSKEEPPGIIEVLEDSQIEGERLSDLPGHTDYFESDVS